MSTATPEVPARRAAAYDRVVNDLAYRYTETFTRDEVQAAVDAGRAALEPIATIPHFLPNLVERFAKDQLLAAAQAGGFLAKAAPQLLFVCVHNAGRSQMAAALAQHLSAGRVHVRSPSPRLPEASCRPPSRPWPNVASRSQRSSPSR